MTPVSVSASAALGAPLDDDALEQLADALAPRIARALRELPDAEPEWVGAAEVARRFGLSRDTVYAHADELGARRFGDGPKARLRFDPRKVERALSARSERSDSQDAGSAAQGGKPPPTRRRRGTGARRVPELLPIRGR